MRSTFLFVLSFLLSFQLFSQSLNGPLIVCENDCFTYHISSTNSGPFFWSVQNGTITTNTGPSLEICWDETTNGVISIIDFFDDPTTPAIIENVAIYKYPQTDIVFPLIPICTTKQDTIEGDPQGNDEFQVPIVCKSACAGSTVTYTSQNPDGLIQSWVIEGAVSFVAGINDVEVNWGDSGTGQVALYEDNGYGCIDSSIYCIEIIEEPDVSINVINSTLDLSSICQNQPIFLEAISDEGLQYKWVTSDGQNEDFGSTNFSFSEVGIHTITLFYTDGCSCEYSTSIDITVIEGDAPQIECTGTVCSGEEATYYASDICGTYNWSISTEGTITEGGSPQDNYITVLWSGGPFGTLNLSVDNCDQPSICSQETQIIIPIIDAISSISGPISTCKSGFSNYSTQSYEGAYYYWSVEGNGIISEGYGQHAITINWSDDIFAADTAKITVIVDNCYLDCQSEGTIDVILKREFDISTPPSYCQNDNGYFYAVSGWDWVNVDWEMTTPSDITIPIETNVSSINSILLDEPGSYKIKATETTGTYCNSEATVYIDVVKSPQPITEIIGANFVCKNEANEYRTPTLPQNLTLKWDIVDGSQSSTITGNPIFYQWKTDGPYSISVFVQDLSTGCNSDTYSKTLLPANQADISGDNMACFDDIAHYELSAIDGFNVAWEVIPASAGTIMKNTENAITVHWHESGNKKIQASYCSETYDFDVVVLNKPSIIVDAPEGVCPGELAKVEFTVDTGTEIVVLNEEGDTIGNQPIANLSAGYYGVKIKDVNGCINEETFSIVQYSKPQALISSVEWGNLCVPGMSAKIEALIINDGYTYQWFQGIAGIPIGTNNPTVVITDPDYYSLIVTNGQGCSDEYSVYIECNESSCQCRPDGGVSFTSKKDIYCNEFDFTNTSIAYNPGSLNYNFGDPNSGIDNTTSNENPSHTFSSAGHFLVQLSGVVPSANDPNASCAARYVDYITVEAAANFDFNEACANELVDFNELSTHLPDYTITDFNWVFGDPSSGASNTSTDPNPSHSFSSAGVYDVTLVITTNTGCLSKITKKITIHESPILDFQLPYSSCVKNGLQFSSSNVNTYFTNWNFGDPSSGPSNSSSNENPIHQFETNGIYVVTLRAESVRGCKSEIQKTINISNTSISGDIALSQPSPICSGDSITLTAPNGGIAYIWSNGASTKEIIVKNTGIYSVTVTDPTLCDYESDHVFIEVLKPIDPIIRGYSYDDNGNSVLHLDKVEICQGSPVYFVANYIWNATFEWTTGEIGTYLGESTFVNYAPGEYLIGLNVTDNASGCIIAARPIKLIIHPNPLNINIVSDNTDLCFGNTFTFSVQNPESGIRYLWNTGEIGTSIIATESGQYYAEGINEYGCTNSSNRIYISPLPDINAFVSGCKEVCFPDTLCYGLLWGIQNYQWLKDGNPIPAPEGTNSTYIATEIGDYQLILENYNGCIDTTHILNLSPETNDQKLSGKVYMDYNENNIFDTGDDILNGVTIEVKSGGTIIQSTTTNTLGEYIFDPMLTTDATVVLDTAGLNLDIDISEFNFNFQFITCIESKVQDFALVSDCLPTSNKVDLFTCENDVVTFLGNTYPSNSLDTFYLINAEGCDSLVYLEVLPFASPSVNISAQNTCEQEDNGTLSISDLSNPNLTFSLDNIIYTNDVVFVDLPSGVYNLWIKDENGCITSESFTIEESIAPNISYTLSNSCFDMNSGAILIDNLSGSGIQFSIDNTSDFSPDITYNNLAVGNHTLYILESNGCMYDLPFTIETTIEPDITLDLTNTCFDLTSGAVQININDGSELMFSLDSQTNYTSDFNFDNLAEGNHILWVLNENGCEFSYDFSIQGNMEPSILFNTINSCFNESSGLIEIINTSSPNVEFSIDDSSIFSDDIMYTNLEPGEHTLWVRDENGCIYSYYFLIGEFVQPNIDLTTTNTCVGTNDGIVSINAVDQGQSYSLDGSNFTNEIEFQNVENGNHTLYVLTSDNCSFGVDFTIEEYPVAIVDIESIPTCAGSNNGIVNIQTSSNNLNFSIDGINFQSNPTFIDLSSGDYTVFIIDDNNCPSQIETNIEVLDPLNVEFVEPEVDCNTLNVDLEAIINSSAGDVEFIWDNGNTENIITISETGNYTVEIIDECETREYTWSIDLTEAQFEPFVFVPNVFSPLLDDENGRFSPLPRRDLDVITYDFKVFDRWGTLMFESDDVTEGWNGFHNNEVLNPAVFVWIYEIEYYKCDELKKVRKIGDVTLIR